MTKTTENQIKIITRDITTVRDFENAEIFPLFGSGEYRSARSLENNGFGEIVSSSKNCYHAANYFFKFANGFRFNYVTQSIEKV